MNPSIKIGLIGCGRAAELIYSPAIKKFSDVEVVAVVDPIEERRKLLSKKFNNCSQYNSIDKNFIDQIDAAVISTPPDTHIALASTLLEHNRYVLVEKPLALSMDGIKELIEIESTSNAFLMMGFNHRYWQPVVNLKEKLLKNLSERQDSNIKSVEIIFSGNYNNWSPISFISDPLNDLGPHVIDLIRFIFNKEIVSISTGSLHRNNLELKIKIPNDIRIYCRIAHSDETIKYIKIITEEEKYFITLASERIQPEPGNLRSIIDFQDMFKRKFLRKTSPIKNTYEVQLKKFFDYVRLNKPATPNIKDGVRALLAIEAARESINKNGKEIFLDEIKSRW